MKQHTLPTNRLSKFFRVMIPHCGLIIFTFALGSGYLLDKHTAKIHIVPCKFDVGYTREGGKRGRYMVGECWTKDLGTVTATLKGIGVIPRKGTWVELTTMTSILRTYREIDIASRATPGGR